MLTSDKMELLIFAGCGGHFPPNPCLTLPLLSLLIWRLDRQLNRKDLLLPKAMCDTLLTHPPHPSVMSLHGQDRRVDWGPFASCGLQQTRPCPYLEPHLQANSCSL